MTHPLRNIVKYLGVSFDCTRRDILCSNGNFDIQTCPGSGKTTLLVAKLIILGERWTHARRGICVVSHTNVARQEIEKKLGDTIVRKRLLNYPHFVGTIQGFLNEYLALPLLRSEGYHVDVIDDEIHGRYCEQLLCSVSAFKKTKFFLDKKDENSLQPTTVPPLVKTAFLTV